VGILYADTVLPFVRMSCLYPRLTLDRPVVSSDAELIDVIGRDAVRTASLFLLILTAGACTTPSDVSQPLSSVPDKNAKTSVKDIPGGFSVDVSYSRYQFIPETGAVITACKSIALAQVRDVSTGRSRAVQTLSSDDVRVSTGRNGLTGHTSCRAFVEAKWR